ncbi:hypothetical protein, partial [Enterococcus faecalis]|uniref:hypothetical protein n=1 Tax=Enterococcus faecalis TaxID=1351 RepID=UPI003D6BE405
EGARGADELPIVLMSASIERLRLKALAGDRTAIEVMARRFPKHLAPGQAKQWRNDDLRSLSQRIIAEQQCTPHRAAVMLTEAG